MLQFCIRLSVNLSHFICRFWVFGDSAHKFLRVWGCEEEERKGKEKERRKKKKRQESAGNRGREMIIVTINNRNNCNSVPEPDSAAPQLL